MLWWKYTRVVGLSFTLQGHVVQSWVKITRVSAKFEFRYESLRCKFSFKILLVYNLMIGRSKKNSREKIVQENASDEKKKRPRLKFNPGLPPIGPQTTGSRAVEVS